MYVSMYVCMYVCIYVYMYICIYVYMCICVYVYMYIYFYIPIFIFLFLFIYLYLYMYFEICTQIMIRFPTRTCISGASVGRCMCKNVNELVSCAIHKPAAAHVRKSQESKKPPGRKERLPMSCDPQILQCIHGCCKQLHSDRIPQPHTRRCAVLRLVLHQRKDKSVTQSH